MAALHMLKMITHLDYEQHESRVMKQGEIKVMVVDDSKVARLLLSHIFRKAGMAIVALAESAAEALAYLEKSRPDVIVMDVEMPEMDGLEATRRIMETHPVPIVIASSVLATSDADHMFRCLTAGALTLVEKPVGPAHPGYARIERAIIRTVRAMADVKVVRRWPGTLRAAAPVKPLLSPRPKPRDVRLVAIGASTGGPNAIRVLLENLDRDFPWPILIVQHMTEGFVSGMAQWLTRSTGHPVSVAEGGESLTPGRVWLAPDGFHMELARGPKIALTEGPLENSARPSVSRFFRSVAHTLGPHSVGILLTGMGVDGASGLKDLYDAGALTLAEDSSTAVVYGMPRAAHELGAVHQLLTPIQISQTLNSLIKQPS